MRCGSFHVGILNSAGEVFLGGDPDFGKLGFQTDKYYGMKKFVSEHIFCAISMAGDSSYLAASNGTLFAFGHQRGLFDDDSAEEEYKVLQFPSVEQISAQNKDIVVCTAQGEVYLNVECQATSLLCNYDASYNVISQVTSDYIFICLSEIRNCVLKRLPLLTHVMHRTELWDLLVLTVT